ncbi:hypothetical protein [Brucella sp. 10RB9213]|uniref:hypothetical protein n=1 Tax=Brucella sp. 10RB9213 TaxID=1844039 RepID=UPI001FFF74D3|nr:hypothetical protein [Brucella sp. 10RB9213]
MRILLRQGSASFVKLPYLIIFMHFPMQIPSPLISGNAPGARSGKRYPFMHKGTQKIVGRVSICVGRKCQNNLPFVYAFSILGEALSFFCNEMQKKRVTFVGAILYIAAHYMHSYIS